MVIWRLRSCRKHSPRSLRFRHRKIEPNSGCYWDAIRLKCRLITLLKKLRQCLHMRRLMSACSRNQRSRVTFARMSSPIPRRAVVHSSCKPSSSFHEDAIADCLEFIKRNSLTAEDSNAYS